LGKRKEEVENLVDIKIKITGMENLARNLEGLTANVKKSIEGKASIVELFCKKIKEEMSNAGVKIVD
jgi:hypothetical protein